MKIIKINTLFNTMGVADYKGLDLTKIVGGTQVYPPDKNEAYFQYEGMVTSTGDITVIDQLTYDAEVTRINALPKPLTDSVRIKELEDTMAVLLMGGVV